MKSNVILLAAVCVGTLAVAGCSSDQPQETMPPNAYVPEAKPVQKTAAQPAAKKSVQTEAVETVDFDIVSAPVQEKKAPAKAVKKSVPKKVAKGDYETVYIVQSGDTLGGIAYQNHLTPAGLASYNGIDMDKAIYVGQKIRIPKVRGVKQSAAKPAAQKKTVTVKAKKISGKPAADETVYVIKSGDTLGGIAYRNHVRVREIEARNGLNEKSILRIGQKLIIPKASIKTAAKTKSAQKKAVAAKEETIAPAVSAAAEPAAAADKALTADDIIGSGNAIPGTTAEPAASAAAAPAPAPAAASNGDTIGFCCTQDMTLQEVADAVGRDYERLKKLNPTLSPTEKLKSGTTVQIYIF